MADAEVHRAPGGHNPWLVAVTVTLATFMEVLDTTIANVALTHIAGSLAAGRSQSTWVLTSYLVANAIILPVSGWIASVVGRKRFYMTCVALFTIASVLCGFATSLGMLVFFRILQGAGGGGLQPSEQGILVDTFPPSKRGAAMSIYGVAILVAPIVGPALGGWITDNYSWRWIFFINVPVGILSLILVHFIVEDPPELERARQEKLRRGIRFDGIGLGLIALGLGSLEVVYAKGQEKDWFGSSMITTFIILAVVGIVAAIIWEWYHDDPIINLRLFKDRNFAACGLMAFVTFAILYGSTTQIPSMLQDVFVYNATQAGFILAPGGLVTMVMIPIVGWMMGIKVDARILIVIGLVVLGGASNWMAHLTLDASPRAILMPRLLQMFGLAFLFAPLNTAAYIYVAKSQTNNATGLFNMLRNEGGSFGIALAETLLARRQQFHQSRLAGNISESNPAYIRTRDQLTESYTAGGSDPVTAGRQAFGQIGAMIQQQVTFMSYLDNFWLFGLLAFVAIPCVFLMKKAVTSGETAAH